MATAHRTHPLELRVSLWFALLSPLIGILIGLLCLVLFAR
jgi:hypothetical protein